LCCLELVKVSLEDLAIIGVVAIDLVLDVSRLGVNRARETTSEHETLESVGDLGIALIQRRRVGDDLVRGACTGLPLMARDPKTEP
jgi:hypothetical protein